MGNYNDQASAVTSFGVLEASPVSIAVDAAHASLSATADVWTIAANSSDLVIFTFNYSNDSNLGLVDASINTQIKTTSTYTSLWRKTPIEGRPSFWKSSPKLV
ncbi:hypothetical protein [Teredinibacter turnerae]|uniref:hypothetical protein n=1 Tax=Teredinibacter turnerae TaxID=2426 RepID=UPI000377E2DD|nr:hypothetical protein [Teredinibacter turnerae]